MFSIFNKREAVKNGKGRASGHPAGAASSARKVSDEDLTFHLEIPVDDAMRALDSRLSSLSHIEVGQGAKERGWATLHRELERHPVRPAAPALLKGTGAKSSMGSLLPMPVGHSRGWRLALTSAGAVVVILAAVLGVYGAGLLSGGTEPISVTTTAVVAVTTPETTEVTTPSTDSTAVTGSTVSTEAPVTTETSPVTTETVTTDNTPGTTPTSGGTTVTTKPNTPTTKPASTTTTNGTINVSKEKVNSAKDAALRLGDAVLAYFMSDADIEGARRQVANSARSALTQMIASLEEPTQVHVLADSVKALSSDGNTVRITLEFVDLNDSPRFFITVHVTDQGATITAISAAS